MNYSPMEYLICEVGDHDQRDRDCIHLYSEIGGKVIHLRTRTGITWWRTRRCPFLEDRRPKMPRIDHTVIRSGRLSRCADALRTGPEELPAGSQSAPPANRRLAQPVYRQTVRRANPRNVDSNPKSGRTI
jgi:hypothetical protein